MKRSRYRQWFLVLLMVMPTVATAGLGWGIIQREAEVSRAQAAGIRERAVAAISKSIEGKLQAIRVKEMAADRVWRGKFSSPAVAIVGWIEDDRLVLPWENVPDADRFQRELGEGDVFARRFMEADAADIAGQHLHAAAVARSLLSSSRNETQRASARLLLARALLGAGSKAEAMGVYRELLKTPSNIVDLRGDAFAYVAAKKVLETPEVNLIEHLENDEDGIRIGLNFGAGLIFDRINADLRAESLAWSPHSVSLVQEILGSLQKLKIEFVAVREGLAPAQKRLASYQQLFTEAKTLQDNFSRLQLTETEWKHYGDGEQGWLVGRAPTAPRRPPLVIAVRANDLYEQVREERRDFNTADFRIADSESAGSYALGNPFPDLWISFSGGDPQTQEVAQLRQRLYAIGFTCIVGMGLIGGILMWRDTRRELHLAELRSQFVSSVSHELKTPLTAIRMFAEVLQMRGAADPQLSSEYLETIVNESERLTRLLNNVLDFSRIERGQKTYRLESVQLADVLRAAARMMQYPLAEQGFVLTLDVNDGLPPVEADRDAIQQAILNLLTNAMKYSGKSRDIELRLAFEDGNALIEVTDHGIGISEKEQAHIFEKFYRAPIPENRAISGTGLGLALVAHIAEAHRGSIHVQSRPGEGSTFSLRLPLSGAGATPRPARLPLGAGVA